MSTELAIARRTFRQVRTTAGVWGLVFGATIASTALSYLSSFPDEASRQQVAATTEGDTGLAILLGPIADIDTVEGYTVYKVFVFLTVIGALWGMLTTTRLLRGEEDAGRWTLGLVGATRPARATLATVGALGAAVLLIGVGSAVGAGLAGRDPAISFSVTDVLVYGSSLMIAPAVFVGVGAVTSQLGRTRSMASGLGMAVFGVFMVVRMVADSGPGTKWLLWCTPFGWVERMQPLTENDLRPLGLAIVAVGGLVGTAAVLAGRRDVGAGVLAPHDVTALRPFGLDSPIGLMTRLGLPTLVAWCAGAAATGLAFGILAKIATGDVPESISDNLTQFGVEGTFLRQFFGVGFLFVVTLVALSSTSQIGTAADDEAAGRTAHLLTHPVRRRTLLAGRLALSTVTIVASGLLAGLLAWAGSAAQGVDPGLGAMVGAGLNVVPTSLVALAIGAVVLAVAPRAASRTIYAVVIASLIIDLLSSLVDGLHGLGRVSLFHYMALAPAADPEATTVLVTLAVAAVLAGVALVLNDRRDVSTG